MGDDRDLRVIPLICPDCGARLTPEPGAVIIPCGACRLLWEPSSEGLRRRDLVVLSGNGDLHLPYWLVPFRVTTTGGEIATLAEFRPLTGNINHLEPDRQSTPPLAFIPAAAGLAPHLMVRAGRLLTLRSPPLARVASFPRKLHPVGLGEEAAAAMAQIIALATVGEERRRNLSFLQEFRVTTGRVKLCAIPFREQGGRYLHEAWSLEL